MKEEMIYGVQYYRAPTPVREEWAQDLENIKKHGFNTIKIWAVVRHICNPKTQEITHLKPDWNAL